MTSVSHDGLRDAIPPGWLLTYLVRGASGSRLHTGIVAGPPVQDRKTGVESIPVIADGKLPGRENAWILEDDVIGFAPCGAWSQESPDKRLSEPSRASRTRS